MKKIFSFCILYFVFCIWTIFAYTTIDISNATYLANQSIVVKQSNDINYRLDDRILRQEVIGIALKMKWITLPENYTCKKYFSDVTSNDWVCRAVEIAADGGMITRANTKARPMDFVTRAEALAILLKTGKISLNSPRRVVQADGSVWSLYQDLQKLGFTQWQADMMDSLPSCLIINHGVSCEDGATFNTAIAKFKPNSVALRSEAFEFAAIMSGFIAEDETGLWILDDLDILLPQPIVPQTPSLPQDPNHLSTETIKSLLKDEPIQTVSASPTVALVVFSDLECPFCGQLFKDTLAPIISDTSTQTALVYKQFPLSFHTYAYPWAVESECIAKNLWSKAYFDYVHTRYIYPATDVPVYDISPDLTKAQMTACLTDDTIAQRIQDEFALGALYGVNGTPTTLIINTKTGYYETIVWAQPKAVFDTTVQAVKDHK